MKNMRTGEIKKLVRGHAHLRNDGIISFWTPNMVYFFSQLLHSLTMRLSPPPMYIFSNSLNTNFCKAREYKMMIWL